MDILSSFIFNQYYVTAILNFFYSWSIKIKYIWRRTFLFFLTWITKLLYIEGKSEKVVNSILRSTTSVCITYVANFKIIVSKSLHLPLFVSCKFFTEDAQIPTLGLMCACGFKWATMKSWVLTLIRPIRGFFLGFQTVWGFFIRQGWQPCASDSYKCRWNCFTSFIT